jgi:hypothetical protein
MKPASDDIDRIEGALGWRPDTWRPAAISRGQTASAARWIAGRGKRSAFVKVGATDVTARLFRREFQNYEAIRASCMPRVLGFHDDGERPVLALEDLSAAHWPPPWTRQQVNAILHALDDLHRITPPDHLEPVRSDDDEGSWLAVAEDPARWAALGLCSRAWLDAALPHLVAAAAAAPLVGDTLVHLDVRGDNVCFRGGETIILDWPEAAISNPDLDLVFWLPSLHSDGGPAPESILPDAPELSAWVAGYFFSRAALPPLTDALYVRPLQLSQARTALPWAARALGLAPPVGEAQNTDETRLRVG